MKYKKLIWLSLAIILVFGSGLTYSVFRSDTTDIGTKDIAKFVFNTEVVDSIELPISDIYPGITKEYAFSVSNNSASSVSNVTLEYELIIKTYNFMPLDIILYKVENEAESPIMECAENETFQRGVDNQLLCNAPIQEMNYDEIQLDNYVLKITFPSGNYGEEYTNLVDFVDIEINSWQKIGE